MSTTVPLWSWGDVDAMAADGALCLAHRTDAARLWVRAGRLVPGVGYFDGRPSARRELARVGAIVRLRERARYLVHAAGVVDPAGRAWLLSGDSGSGKSTLAYALVRAGWKLLGDDGVIVEVRATGAHAYAWRDPLRVSSSLADAFPELTAKADRADRSDPRSRVSLDAAGVRSAPLGAIVFVRRAASVSVTRLAPIAAIGALIRQSPWVIIRDSHTRTHLNALARLAGMPCFRFDHTPAELHTVASLLAAVA